MSEAAYKSYFAAANTERGFKSFFEEIFFSRNITKRYIIKGGPGTGKISLMKRYARNALESGHSVELYYCSSDTSSLDGVVVDGESAIFDGTAPHSHDTVLPGAVDSIINLGAYWNEEPLRSRRTEIEELGRQKSANYRLAYDFLSAYGNVSALADRAVENCLDKSKLNAAVLRLLPSGKGSAIQCAQRQTRQVSAFGVHGEVHFDTLTRAAGERIFIEDYYGSAAYFLEILAGAAVNSGFPVWQSFAVPRCDLLSEIYCPTLGLWVGVGKPNDGERVIKMKRFVRADALSAVRGELRAILSSARTLYDIAATHLVRAGELHASIEKYYVIAMDFEKMQADLHGRGDATHFFL